MNIIEKVKNDIDNNIYTYIYNNILLKEQDGLIGCLKRIKKIFLEEEFREDSVNSYFSTLFKEFLKIFMYNNIFSDNLYNVNDESKIEAKRVISGNRIYIYDINYFEVYLNMLREWNNRCENVLLFIFRVKI